MRALLPLMVAALVAQEGTLPDLEQDYLRQFSGSYQHAVTIVATHQDGRPWRGAIYCDGWWVRYADETELDGGYQYPFRADSRGGVVMNPRKDDAPFVCYAGGSSVVIDFERPDNVYHLELK